MSTYSVDRLEGEVAVLVDDECRSFTVRLEELPSGVKEGMVLRRTECGYVADIAEEECRRNQVLSLQEKLRRRAK